MQRILLTILLISVYTTSAFAQEALVGLYKNSQAKPQPKRAVMQSWQGAPAGPLSLPFVDDFAGRDAWPNTELWESRGVFINTAYGINPPSIGVATFDALDDNGYMYPHIYSLPDTADVLTSYPIELASKSNVVLSFFVQPGGRGDIPESGDLLLLQLFSPDDGEWHLAWSASCVKNDSLVERYYLPNPDYPTFKIHEGRADSAFIYVAIEVNEPRFLRTGFRFRFANLASMVSSPVPGRESNCDHWNLDYVYLDEGRQVENTQLPDVAICEPQTSLALAYTSVPAAHLNSSDAHQKLFGNPMEFALTYQNLGWGTRNVTRRFSIKPLSGSDSYPQEYLGGSENIFNDQKFVREYTFEPFDFSSRNDVDSASFEIKSYLITDIDPSPFRQALRANDTTVYIQKFYNYYSYDDGVSENGYGLYGVGTSNGRVAVRYTSYMTDSLRAISMYFNAARDSANAKAFFVTVWADNDGTPGDVLYSQKISSPVFSDLNNFVIYKLPKAIEIKRGQTFYVGWIQASEVFLNVGFDVNSPYSDIMLYNMGGIWYPSIYSGAPMIRPVFGSASAIPDDATPLPVPPPVKIVEDKLILYPNPANDVVNLRNKISDTHSEIPSECSIYIYDLSGQLLYTTTTANGSFSVARLESGLYVVRILENNQLKATRKILVSR